MTYIFLIRHAEAEGNLYKRAHGIFDSNLTPLGRVQSEKLAERFKRISIDMCYSSTLNRAFCTAKPIASVKGLETLPRRNLKEMDLGLAEDLAWREVRENYPALTDNWIEAEETVEILNSESPKTVGNRIYEEIERLAIANKDKTIVIVSHGLAIKQFYKKVMGEKYTEAFGWCENAAVSKLDYDGDKFTYIYTNDTSHLEGLRHPFYSEKWDKLDDKEIEYGVNLDFRPVDISTEEDIIFSMIPGDKGRELLQRCIKSQEREPKAISFVLYKEKICGICMLNIENLKEMTIEYLMINDNFQNLGFAPEIIGYVANIVRKTEGNSIRLYIDEENKKAIKFFEKIGFEKSNFEVGEKQTVISEAGQNKELWELML